MKVKALKIDAEFKALCPPLSSEEWKQLESNIVADGRAISPLIVWNGMVVDGHNRLAICTKHDLPYETEDLPEGDEPHTRQTVMVWIISHQMGRRNISPFVRTQLAMRLQELLAPKGKERMRDNGGDRKSSLSKMINSIPDSDRINTQAAIAKAANVSTGAVAQVARITEAHKAGKVDDETIAALRKGDTTIGKVYGEVKRQERQTALREREADLRSKAAAAKIDTVHLAQGDVLDMIDTLQDGSVHLLLTDPPYFVTDNEWDKWDSEEDFLDFMRSWLEAMRPKMATDYTCFVFCDADRTAQTWQLLRQTGYEVQRQAIWYRPNLAKKRSGSLTFLSSYEPFWHCGTRALNMPAEWGDERFDVQTFPVPQTTHSQDQSLHPTQKPLDLFRRLVCLGSQPGETVVDPFVGSGTTAVACIHEKRIVHGFDQSDDFVRLAKGRCSEALNA